MARRDSGEFTAFVLASQPRLRRTAYLMCGDWQLASDRYVLWYDTKGGHVGELTD
ncbi:MAG: hypothetical protein J2P22_10290 [Nocardioides sp.]|nr:hypothetical protein [Nocardioides sp.]